MFGIAYLTREMPGVCVCVCGRGQELLRAINYEHKIHYME